MKNSSALNAETITIDARGRTRPFPHYWEKTFGSGRAILTLRDSYRRDLRDLKAVTGFEYLRFHGIFHDEIGIYDEDNRGKPVYNFSYVDQIYDGLLENGVRPFVELSFMPRKLASRKITHPFWYKPITAPPKDWGCWEELIYQFTKHLVERYTVEEVAQWYFEVWNEPNIDFWSGKPKAATYYKLYEHAARAIKRVSSLLCVGGPSTARSAWVSSFIQYCARRGVPVDFISIHIYANDSVRDIFGAGQDIPRSDMVARVLRKVHDQVKRSARPELPIFCTEYNATFLNDINITDAPFMGPWLANTIRLSDGLVTMLSYWALSDVFEEQGVVKRPFYGGYGLVAVGHIPKASYNAFKLLHLLGTERLTIKSSSAIATRRADGSLAIALWNYSRPVDAGSPRQANVIIKGLSGPHRLRIHLLDRNNGSPLATWQTIGRPSFPTREQQHQLRRAAELAPPKVQSLPCDSVPSVSFNLLPHSLMLIEVLLDPVPASYSGKNSTPPTLAGK